MSDTTVVPQGRAEIIQQILLSDNGKKLFLEVNENSNAGSKIFWLHYVHEGHCCSKETNCMAKKKVK
jgi:hypothetical protein